MTQYDLELDTRGMNCPLPIVKASKKIMELDAGQVLRVLSTDPGSMVDFKSFCDQTGHELVASGNEDEDFVFLIKKQ